jgi:hypothetical protein
MPFRKEATMTAAPAGARNLFKAALVLFVITVVIGILNGTDIWDPPRNTLLTHVHAGTLGWITLSVFGASVWMFGGTERTSGMATFSIVAMSLYVLAFWSGDIFDTTVSIQRPIGGTLAFIAIVWVFVWALRQKRGKSWTVAEFGMGLALFFLLIGAILGVALGLQLADVEVLPAENAGQLGDAHPAAMVIGYVVLAMLAIIEWRLRGDQVPTMSEAKAGVVQMLLMFFAGLFGMLGLLLDVEGLLIANTPLQVIGLLVFLWRLRRELAPSRWGSTGVANVYTRTAMLGLIVAVALTAVVVNKFVSGGEDEEALFEEILPLLVSLDHATFLLVVTNVILGMLAASSMVGDADNWVIYAGLNIGAVGFIVGLLTESATMKRIFTPILGLALLYAIVRYLVAKPREQMEVAPAPG